jgi:hypothetical protein
MQKCSRSNLFPDEITQKAKDSTPHTQPETHIFPKGRKPDFISNNKENLSLLNNLVNNDINNLLSHINLNGLSNAAINNGFSSRTFDNNSASPILANQKNDCYQHYKRLSQNFPQNFDNSNPDNPINKILMSNGSHKSLKQPVKS